ncbi:MAG: hypothetical protein JNL12_13810 [Planctomycetes bacterium]|nr:hypothetical protein [Planctomycetota bacterium]
MIEFASKVTLPAGKTSIRLEIQDGTIGIAAGPAGEVSFAGGARRAGESAEELVRIEAVPLEFRVVDDPTQPTVLVLRGPELPPSTNGILALELGVHLPPDLPLELKITGLGHVTLADRAAASRVTTRSGDLRFERCAGGVVGKTGAGNVIAFEHQGDLDIHAGVGDMQVFVRAPANTIRLVTGQGTLQCHVPPSLGFEVDARVDIGRIGNGFGLTATTVADYGAVLVGRREPAGTKIVLRTARGHISLAPKPFE